MKIVTSTFQSPDVMDQDRIRAMAAKASLASPVGSALVKATVGRIKHPKRTRTAYSGAYDVSQYGSR